jgi:hypothetical protein
MCCYNAAMPKAFPLFCAVAFLCLCIAALKIWDFLSAFPQNDGLAILFLAATLLPLLLVFATSVFPLHFRTGITTNPSLNEYESAAARGLS